MIRVLIVDDHPVVHDGVAAVLNRTSDIRLVGAVTGTPPFTGKLRHAGWRATAVNIPRRSGQDPQVIAPAEVEIG